jgi:integrase
MAVLKAPKDTRVHKPTPVSRENFHAVLAAADADYPDWRPRLLAMLNLCVHFDEALDVEWDDFDFDKGTFCTRRNKRGRVIRCAVLWPETITALKGIVRTGSPYVFTSRTGTRFNAKGAWKTWNKLRTAAKCPEVQMDDVRDGAYSAACNAVGVEEKFARLLAGHRSHGLQDSYVQRNPTVVGPACEAVYAAFGPFPTQPK